MGRAKKRCVSEQVTAVSSWSSSPLGPCWCWEKVRSTHLRALPPKGQGAGELIHQHPLVTVEDCPWRMLILTHLEGGNQALGAEKPPGMLMLAVGSATGPMYTEMVRTRGGGVECLELQQPSCDHEAVAKRLVLRSEVTKTLN